MKLTLEQSAYFDSMDALFMSEGWRFFMDDVTGWRDALKDSFESVDDLLKLGVVKGRLNMAQQILHYQSVVEEGRKALEDAPEPELETDV